MTIQAIGYKLSSEEHSAPDLVRYARRAEACGMDFAAISDHFHPWIDQQGQSPFVWGVLGALSQATDRLSYVTGVTCPTIRTHPAIIAQAAATATTLLPGRFSLGLGTGENLNEHVVGEGWPRAGVRLDMLEEAIHVIRELWQGKNTNHEGRHYTVENARIYSLPEQLPPIIVAGDGERAIKLAAEEGDGYIGLAPDSEVLQSYASAGGKGRRFCEVTVCWAPTRDDALKITKEWWPTAGLKGELMQELPLPRHFEQAAEMTTEEALSESVSMGPDPDEHLENINKYVEAGYDNIWLHHVGPDQDGFFDFYEKELKRRL